MQFWDIAKIVAEIVGLLILGAFGGLYLFSKSMKEKRKEENDAEDRLAKILKDTVDELEKKVDVLEKGQVESTKKIDALVTENKIVKDLLQGKDARSLELYEMTKTNTEGIKNLYSLMERHISLVEKALNITVKQS